jgi:hypothetical protein
MKASIFCVFCLIVSTIVHNHAKTIGYGSVGVYNASGFGLTQSSSVR